MLLMMSEGGENKVPSGETHSILFENLVSPGFGKAVVLIQHNSSDVRPFSSIRSRQCFRNRESYKVKRRHR